MLYKCRVGLHMRKAYGLTMKDFGKYWEQYLAFFMEVLNGTKLCKQQTNCVLR